MKAILALVAALALAACHTVAPTNAPAPSPAAVAAPIGGVAFGALVNPLNLGSGKQVDDGAKFVQQLPAFKVFTGTTPNPVHMFVQYGDSFPAVSAAKVSALGSVPFITVMCDQSASLAQVIAGKDDAYYRRFFSQAAAYGKVVYVRPFHEMNDADVHSCGTAADPALFVQAWRHVRGLSAAANIKWVWCPSARPTPAATDPYYPGDDVVDVIAGDHYANATNGAYDGSFHGGTFPAWFAHYAAHGKPMMVAETAATQPYQGAYIADMGATLRNTPGVIAAMWWDSAGGAGGSHPGFSWNLGDAGAHAWHDLVVPQVSMEGA